MTEILFHPALWMPIALFVVGAGVFIYGNARVQTGVRNVGVGLVLLTFAWCGVAYFVDTFTEKCVKRTDAIIAAVEDAKWDELAKLLDKNTQLSVLRGSDEIAKTTERYAGTAQLKEIRIINTDIAVPFPGAADVTIDTFIEAQQNATSTWTFSYEQRSDGILLTKITPIRLNGQSMEQIERVIGRISR